MSSTASPARSSTLRVAGTGPIPITSGETPATAVATTRAIGVMPRAFAYASDTTSAALAPSLIPLDEPAVTVPPSRTKAGFIPRSASRVVSGRGCSSTSTTVSRPLRSTIRTGTSSSANRRSPAAHAARRWLSWAKASCASRVMP